VVGTSVELQQSYVGEAALVETDLREALGAGKGTEGVVVIEEVVGW